MISWAALGGAWTLLEQRAALCLMPAGAMDCIAVAQLSSAGATPGVLACAVCATAVFISLPADSRASIRFA